MQYAMSQSKPKRTHQSTEPRTTRPEILPIFTPQRGRQRGYWPRRPAAGVPTKRVAHDVLRPEHTLRLLLGSLGRLLQPAVRLLNDRVLDTLRSNVQVRGGMAAPLEWYEQWESIS